MKLILPLLFLMLSGCAAVVEPIAMPDGRSGFSVSCNGSIDNWAKCYNAAGQACGAQGYEIIDKQQSSTPTAYGPMVTRDLIVSCKKKA